MANQPRDDNPARAFRCDDELWTAVQAAAAERGEPVSNVIRRALVRYVATHERSKAKVAG